MATQTAVPHRRSFKNLADFAAAVRRAAESDHTLDPRLVPMAAAPSTFSQEGNGPDGGYAVPPDIRAFVSDALLAETSLLGLTDRVTTQSNSVTIPADASPQWIGLQPTIQNEGTQVGQVKLALQARTVRLTRVQATIPVSNELFDDAPGLEAYLKQSIPDRLDFAITNYLLNGDGVNKPLGVLNSPALITIAKEGAQGVGTLLAPNLSKMWGALWTPSKKRAVWVMHSTVEAALQQIALPPGLFTYDENGPVLFGRPVLVSEACQVIGTPGDALLIDPKAILTATREGEVREDISAHCWFDLDLSAFRFAMRVGATPWWSSTVMQKNGGGTVSTAVVIEPR